jgi:hypothetical protein
MAVNPANGIGLTPSGFFIKDSQVLGYDSLIFLLFVPDRSPGFVHYLTRTDDLFIAQVQEI